MKLKKVLFRNKLTWTGGEANNCYWDQVWSEQNEGISPHNLIPYSFTHFLKKLDKNTKILEAGCGDGRIVNALLEHGYNTVGTDTARQTVEHLQSHGLPVYEMDVRNLAFADNEFDAYISLGVVEHFYKETDIDKTLKEAIRVTKPGGTIFCSVPFTNILRKFKLPHLNHMKTVALSDFFQHSYSIAQFQLFFENLPLETRKIWHENTIMGITDELSFLKWIEKKPFCDVIEWVQQYTGWLNLFSHMISFELTNQKQREKTF